MCRFFLTHSVFLSKDTSLVRSAKFTAPAMTQFGRAVQLLLELADSELPLSSAFLASRVGTNPAFVREILQNLNDARLTKSRLGPGGGAMLARPESKITLGEVYLVVAGASPIEHVIADAMAGVTLADVGRRARRLRRARFAS
jgi:hypothetical protein